MLLSSELNRILVVSSFVGRISFRVPDERYHVIGKLMLLNVEIRQL